MLSAKDVYDALDDSLGGEGSNYYIEDSDERHFNLKNVTVDGGVDCEQMAEFLNKRLGSKT
jgi:hypothetical protein